MTKAKFISIMAGLVLSLVTGSAVAHWCSNIFAGAARLVVKPEQTTVAVGSGGTTLKVYLQNNFPYKLFNTRMRGTASGYTITVSPTSQTVHPGQNVAFTFTISGPSGSVQVSQLNLQAQFRVGSWRGGTDSVVSQTPTQSYLVGASVYDSGDGEQSPSLNAGTLADKFPSATLGSGSPFFGRTGIQQLAHWFGYRFCYGTGGSWRCSSQDCPSPCAEGSAWSSIEQFPQNCMRAGVDLGIRKSKLGSNLTAARNGATNAVQVGVSGCTPGSTQCGGEHRCLAAVVGGLLWNGAASTAAFESALNGLPSYLVTCKDAGLRALGKTSTTSTCNTSAHDQYYKKAACAAAEGLRGNDGPVTSLLMPNSGDGDSSGDYDSLYWSYMLYLVTGDRYAQGKYPSYYPAVGTVPTPDQGVTPTPDKGTNPTPDFGGPPPDGWVPPEQGVVQGDQGVATGDGTPPNNNNGSSLDGGCGCRVGHATPSGTIGLLLLLALLLRRRCY